MIRLVVAEDHPIVRDGLRLILSAQPDIELVAEIADGADVVATTRRLRPDVLLLDLGLPNMDGLAIMQALAGEQLPTRVLVVTARTDAASVRTCFTLGATGYLTKGEPSEAMLAAIRRVAEDEHFVSADIAGNFRAEETPRDVLTEREQEVLREVGGGLSSKEIARKLGISDLTVKKHRENLCHKLKLRNGAELVAFAARSALA